jgi:hypothetical protein
MPFCMLLTNLAKRVQLLSRYSMGDLVAISPDLWP